MDLDRWESLLEAHFRLLREARAGSDTNAPLYALEHGLSSEQVEGLRSAVRVHIRRMRPSNAHRLSWAVYATESGYTYSGDEFWQSFGDETPGWARHGNRNWIRSCFRYFADNFCGAVPTGPWARQFTIISWPITHAILPMDLQRQLARTLYEIRHLLGPEYVRDPERLGRLIHARSSSTSSRFQQFAQEALLIGQIAASLLLHASRDEATGILPATLKRIAIDLEREERAREWLRDAQATTITRLRQQSIGPGGSTTTQARPTSTRTVPGSTARLALEPRLLLRAGDAGWAVFLEIPNLDPLTRHSPELKHVLENARCWVRGAAADRPMARGRVLSGSRRVEIRTWPRENEVPLVFEPSTPELDELLRMECRIRPGPSWLFKPQGDGFAREVKSKRIKPGGKYVLVSIRPLPTTSGGFLPLNIGMAGVEAALLSVPDVVNDTFVRLAGAFGIRLSTEVDIWPAGLCPVSWDGIGRGEWLSTDTPRLGLRSNIAIEHLLMTVGRTDPVSLDLRGLNQGETRFIDIPNLDIGTHQLHISTSGETPGDVSELGSIEIVIREPHPWVPANDESSPLLVIPDPRTPTLEQLWDGDASFYVQAPRSCPVECHLSLFDSRAEEPFLETEFPRFTPPVEPREWRRYFTTHLRKENTLSAAFDRASRCLVEFRAQEFGTFAVTCERESTPVRWIVSDSGSEGYRIRVVDDRGSDSELALRFYGFNSPDHGQVLDPVAHLRPTGAPADGGLYVAEWKTGRQSVVVPNQIRSFQDLDVDPRVRYRAPSKGRAINLIRQIETWHGAGLRGGLSALVPRRKVVDLLLRNLVDVVGNRGWASAERAFEIGGASAAEKLENAVSSVGTDNLYADTRFACQELDGDRRRLQRVFISWLAEADEILRRPVNRQSPGPWGEQVSPRPPEWTAEFALRLVSAPRSIRAWANSGFECGLNEVFRKPGLLRAARFAVLVAESEFTPEPLDPDILYTGWNWP